MAGLEPADNILIYVADQGLHWDRTADQSERREASQSVSQSGKPVFSLRIVLPAYCLPVAFLLTQTQHNKLIKLIRYLEEGRREIRNIY